MTAERIISAIFTGSLDDIDPRTSWETQNILMATIIGDEQLEVAGLESFLGEARKLPRTRRGGAPGVEQPADGNR